MTHAFFATTAKHMESLLSAELQALGCENVVEGRAGASFSGGLTDAYRVCLWSRVANRVLLVLAHFPAATPEDLYAGVYAIAWDEHFHTGDTFAVDFSTSQSAIAHSHFGALKVKDAIADRFRTSFGERPSVRTEQPDVQINVYLLRDQATLSLDLSGDSLHRRGYRDQGVAAPLKETLAAAILLRAGWPEVAARGGPLLDPMCGSGTLPIEGAFMAADIAPGMYRDYWGFQHWRQHDEPAWQALLEEAWQRRERGLGRLPDIRGYDHDAQAVRAALANVERAGLHGHVHIEKRDLEACAPLRPDLPGLVVANPPYGERLGRNAELSTLYTRLGGILRERFSGWRAAVFTGSPELGKTMGLRARRMHTLYNGALECKLLHFDITAQWFVSTQPRPLTNAQRSESAQMLANRLRKNLKHLGRWVKREAIHAYRLYDADLPEYAIAVDVYQGDKRWVHVQEYEAPKTVDPRKARLRLREALGVLLDVLEIPDNQLFFKVRRIQKGHAQYEQLAATQHFREVREDGCTFLVNFDDYLDTGLFLDHRLTRAMVSALAQDRHFLNLFAYTGSASVYAAKGGALSTTTVDMSKTYLDWAQRNMALNGFSGSEHHYIQTDCLSWLDTPDAARRKYGLIFLDPPTFSTSKRMTGTFDVQRDHIALITQALRHLSSEGILIFSTNLRRFKLDIHALPDLVVEDITRATLPKDFERNPRIHHCWKIHLRTPQ